MKQVIKMSKTEYQEFQNIWFHFATIIIFPMPIIFLVLTKFDVISALMVLPLTILVIYSFNVRNKFLKKHTKWVTTNRLKKEIIAFYFMFIIAIIKAILITTGVVVYIGLSAFVIIISAMILGIFVLGATSAKVLESYREIKNKG